MPTPPIAYVEAAHYFGEIDISIDSAVQCFFENLPADKRAIVLRYLLSREGSPFYLRAGSCSTCAGAGVIGGGFSVASDYCSCAIGRKERTQRTPLADLPAAQHLLATIQKENSMLFLKQRIYNFLISSGGHTAEEITTSLPQAAGRQSTVERALRSLREDGKAQAQPIVGSQRKLWFGSVASNGASTGSPANASPNQKVQSMSPLPTLTLAVEAITNEFVSAKRAFSAYNVTTELRERVSKKLVTIDPDETGLLFVDGPNRIDHDVVKEIVHTLFIDHKLDGYTRQSNGSYWEYAPLPTSTASGDPSQASPV